MAERVTETLPSQARYYRRQAAAVQARLDERRRYRGRIQDVRLRDQWIALAVEVETYLRRKAADDGEPDRSPTADDVALF